MVDLGVGTVEILEICDEVEEKELEVFGPQIELDPREESSIHDLGEPPVEVAGVAPTVVEIFDEPSKKGKAVEELRTGASPVNGKRVIPALRITRGDTFEKVREITPEETLQSPLTLFLRFPRRKPLSALNQGGRGLRPWLGGRI